MEKSRTKFSIKKLLFPLITGVVVIASLITGFIAVNKMPYPIPISTEDEFYLFTEKYKDGYFVLKNPITFTEPIKPIGDKNHPFKGMIDGGSYNLNNVIIDFSFYDDSYFQDNQLYVGIFPFNEGVIMNLNISGLKFSNLDSDYTDIVCGGICGRNDGRVSNSSLFNNNIDLTCDFNSLTFGSIVGENRCEIHKCKMFQNILISGETDTLICGGIVGTSKNGLVDRCYRKGWIGIHNFTGFDVHVGGICGASSISTFSDCALYDNFPGSNAGFNFYDYNVANQCNVGGILGSDSGNNDRSVITNSYCSPSFSIRDNNNLTLGLCYGKTDKSLEVKNTVVSVKANIGTFLSLGLFDVGQNASKDSIDNSFMLIPNSSNKNFHRLLEDRSIGELSLDGLNWDSSFWSITDKIECLL